MVTVNVTFNELNTDYSPATLKAIYDKKRRNIEN
jgi:hypothetical protein